MTLILTLSYTILFLKNTGVSKKYRLIVLIIYALTKGYLDDIPVDDITRFEDELNLWAKSNATELLNEIKTSGALPKDDAFESAINEFKKSFSKSEA